VPGWLTLYGYYRVVRGMNSIDALNKVLEEGAAIVTSELEKVIERSRDRYTAILKAIATGFKRWKDIKAFVEARTRPIPPNKFSELLERLVKYGYVKKINEEYVIDDPIVKHAVLSKL
jgi:AAA+ ATPase superfamily predicted ATPase